MRGASSTHPLRGTRRLHRLAALGLTAVLVAASAGCSWLDEPADEEPTVVADPSLRETVTEADLAPFAVEVDEIAGPGTPLGGGLSVPAGAALLGAPFPDLTGGGFRALLLITGDPVEVYNAMGEQSGGLGMDRAGGCLGTAIEVGCVGRFVDQADGESLEVSVLRRAAESGVVSGMGLRYRPPGSDEVAEAGAGGTSGPTQPLPSVVLPSEVGPPGVEDLVAALRAPGSTARALEVGSELIGLPGPCACGGQGWSFVTVVDGKVEDLIAAYARQFSDLGDPPDVSSRRVDGVTIFGLRVGEGEAHAEIRAINPDVGSSYVLVSGIGL